MNHRMTGILTGIALLLLLGACHSVTPGRIVMDGQLGDWAGISPIVTVKPEKTPGFTAIYVTDDQDSVFVRLDLDTVINYQSLIESTLTLYFDADGNRTTGSKVEPLIGSDIAIELSPHTSQWPGRPRQGVRVQVFSGSSEAPEYTSGYAIGVMGVPAFSAKAFEFRIARGQSSIPGLRLFESNHLRGKLVHGTSQEHVLQQSADFEYQLSDSDLQRSLSDRQIKAQLRPDDPKSIRVAAWNIADNLYYERFDAYARILSAIGADVLLFDEAPDDISEQSVRRLISEMGASVAASDWHIQIGQGGGRQRVVIASHLPITAVKGFDPLLYDDETIEFVHENGTRSMTHDLADMANEGMPVLAAELDWNGRKILLTSMDFQCCGFDGSPEDQFRSLQAMTIRRALRRQMIESGQADALILAGDINLVGSYKPLETLYAGTDLDGSDLANANPLQLDQLSTATFGFRGPFPPGQLDYLLFSDSSLQLERSFVFDSRDVPEALATELGVKPLDSTRSSDHLPIVADFQFR
jgi:hypothetical protein